MFTHELRTERDREEWEIVKHSSALALGQTNVAFSWMQSLAVFFLHCHCGLLDS